MLDKLIAGAAQERAKTRRQKADKQAVRLSKCAAATAKCLMELGIWMELEPYASEPKFVNGIPRVEFRPPESMELLPFYCFLTDYEGFDPPAAALLDSRASKSVSLAYGKKIKDFFCFMRERYLEERKEQWDQEVSRCSNRLSRTTDLAVAEQCHGELMELNPERASEWNSMREAALAKIESNVRARMEREGEKDEKQKALMARVEELEVLYNARADALAHNQAALSTAQKEHDEPFTVYRLFYAIGDGDDPGVDGVWVKNHCSINGYWSCIRLGGIVDASFWHEVSLEKHIFKPTDDRRPVCKQVHVPGAKDYFLLPYYGEMPEIPGLVELPPLPRLDTALDRAATSHVQGLRAWPQDFWTKE